MREFLWVPGQGMDPAALERLRNHFRCPKEPMGEAWFMGEERKMFAELKGDPDQLPVSAMQEALVEIASGHSAFGPMEEWHEWYHYLLPRAVQRGHEGSFDPILETLVTAFIAIYPNGVHEAPYKTFREDTLLTIGRCIMEPGCWSGRDIAVGNVLHRSNRNPAGIWGWWNASGDFAASMVFCLKYLPRGLVLGWFRSVLNISSPHWRASFIVWAVGMHEMFEGKVKWPAEWDVQAKSTIHWDWSWCLGPELATRDATDHSMTAMDTLLPLEARDDALHLLRLHFSEDVFLEWLESISSVDYLESELGGLSSEFERLYVSRPKSPIIIQGAG